MEDDGMKRTFDTGATRDTAEEKYDYEGFLSPLVINRFGEYMHKHRLQSDGTLRDSDNWQKGIPKDVYFMDLWDLHRNGTDDKATERFTEGALCALLFNVMGYLHEHLKKN